MNIEASNPAEDRLDELIGRLIVCAARGKQLSHTIFELQREHEATTREQIAVDGEINTLLDQECHDYGRRLYIKQLIADKLRKAVYPDQVEAGGDVANLQPTKLRLVSKEAS